MDESLKRIDHWSDERLRGVSDDSIIANKQREDDPIATDGTSP
jgi:hypothetical protein